MRIHVLHENPEWFGPIGHALDAAGLPYEQWLLGDGALDLSQPPPSGVFWSRLSASSAARASKPGGRPDSNSCRPVTTKGSFHTP